MNLLLLDIDNQSKVGVTCPKTEVTEKCHIPPEWKGIFETRKPGNLEQQERLSIVLKKRSLS